MPHSTKPAPALPFGPLTPRALEVALLYNATRDVQRGNETDALPDFEDGLGRITGALEALGHRVKTLGVSYENLPDVDRLTCDFALNLCDGSGLDGHPGLEVAAALEARGIPFSGAGSWCFFQTNGKWRTKLLLSSARVPVPRGVIMPSPDLPLPSLLNFPLFVKPRDAYGSLGVDEGSVVRTPEEARARVARIVSEYGSHALVEEYVEGREITVGVLGAGPDARALPPLEVTFGRAYDGKPPIRMFATKHEAGSELYTDFQTLCPAPLTPDLDARVRSVALTAYRAVGGDGYGRVDMRLTASGTPYVLEVNANCSLEDGDTPEDCGMFVLIGRAMGWSYAELLARIIEAGLARPAATTRTPYALAWHRGQALARAMAGFRAGERVATFGPVYPGAPRTDDPGVMVTTTGRRAFVEPHARCLGHADDPNLEVVRDGTGLWLDARREIRPNELLTIDRTRPLDAPARRQKARGWSLDRPSAYRQPAAEYPPGTGRSESGRRSPLGCPSLRAPLANRPERAAGRRASR